MTHQFRLLFSGMIGNLIEAYDVTICVYMAFYINHFIIGHDNNDLTIVLALFCLAYLARPIGAIILGVLSDLIGRKKILIFSILTVGLSTTLIALIPSHTSIGYLAPVALLILRIIQSFACGSEYLSTVSFLVESGDKKQKTFRGSFTSFGIMSGVLIASLVTEFLNTHVSATNESWIWRLPFLLAGVGTLFGFYIRAKIPESLEYVKYYSRKEKPQGREIFKHSVRFLVKQPFIFNYAFITSLLSISTTFLFYIYVPIHAQLYQSFNNYEIFLSNIASLILMVILIPIFGYWSDRFDRLKVMQWSTAFILILSYPFIYALNYTNFTTFLLMQLAITVPTACYYSVASVVLTDLFPIEIRCTVLSFTYSLISANLAAGIIPLLAMTLINKTHILTSPSWIVISVSCIALINFSLLHKNYRKEKNEYRSVDFVLAN